MTNLTPQKILALPMIENDANAKTVADYLFQLAEHMWIQEDGADGKRPFGNSGWQHEVFASLVKGGAIPGEWDEDEWEESKSAYGSYEVTSAKDWADGVALVASLFKFLRSADPLSFQLPPEPKDWYVVNIDADYPGDGITIEGPYTQEVAATVAKESNSDEGTTTFKAVHIPK